MAASDKDVLTDAGKLVDSYTAELATLTFKEQQVALDDLRKVMIQGVRILSHMLANRKEPVYH